MEYYKGVCLASASPRRIALLKNILDDFTVFTPNVDESVRDTDPTLAVKTIAERKAGAVSFDGVVISADTVVYDGKILGKPKDETDALQILSSLNGKSHFVYTGVCIKTPYEKKVFCVETKVFFKNLTKDELIEYVKKYRPLDKAGAYGIQDGILVDKIEGSYDNVVGFPTKEVKEALIKLGVKVKE